MTCACSSAVPRRCSGMVVHQRLRMISVGTSSSSAIAVASSSSRSVRVKPGNTLFTVTPGGSSLASDLAHEAIAPRIVLDTPRFGSGSLTEVEMTLMIRP